ncbi:unnamed protein product [Plutella xylostella]|uniref:(diamondback moth) hypothetical protein n=1 Tax=Plutella xylostella TaxID=51655 RepID=A0A8S4D8Z2_PLUXY|nr:unnamed protein product [Plutella xylostella]
MDDLLIPSATINEGFERLEEVLQLLQQAGLTLKLQKCSFFDETIEYLGYEISASGIRPSERKILAVKDFPAPRNVHEMASIEVSLAGARRRGGSGGVRDMGREFDALKAALNDKDTLIQNLKKQLSASLSAARLAAQASPAIKRSTSLDGSARLSPDERKALEERAAAVKADLETRKNNIQELKRRLEKTHVTDNIDSRIQAAELEYQVGREELELQALAEQARALQQLMQRAAAAAHSDSLYDAVRELGGCAALVSAEAREGAWGAALRGGAAHVDWSRENCLRAGDRLVEVNGVCVLSCSSETELSRAAAAAAPARLVILRSHHTGTSNHNLTQSEASSLRAELGLLRASSDEAERAKQELRADNTRLTHRISYLEDQVHELLASHKQLQPVSSNDSSCITVNKSKKNVTNISISSEPAGAGGARGELQVFQKGPDITALVARLPGLQGADAGLPVLRPRSNASGASSRAAASPRASPPPRAPSAHSDRARMRHSLSHHCIHADYSAETDAAIRMIERNQRHMDKQRLRAERRARSEEDALRDPAVAPAPDPHRHIEIKKAADRIEESIKKTNWAERKTLSIIEQLKRSQRMRKLKKNDSAEDVQLEAERHHHHRIDGKVLENAHKSSRRSSRLHSRSAKSSEMESECSDFPGSELYHSSPRIDCGGERGHYRKHEERSRPDGEPKPRPTPPRKPLRLSLHKARSAHSLAHGSESEYSRPPSEAYLTSEVDTPSKKPVKRSHARDGGARDGGRDAGRATPRPARKLLPGLSACEAPPPDRLYPDHAPLRKNSLVNTGKWC